MSLAVYYHDNAFMCFWSDTSNSQKVSNSSKAVKYRHIYIVKVAWSGLFCENLYLHIFWAYQLFGLMVILVHTFMTYLAYLWTI